MTSKKKLNVLRDEDELFDYLFVCIWTKSKSVKEATYNLNKEAGTTFTTTEVFSWARWYRRNGVKLKRMPNPAITRLLNSLPSVN